MEKTWLHHYTPEFNRQSAERISRDKPNPKRGKTQQSASKIAVSVFWYVQGIYSLVILKSSDQQQRLLHSVIYRYCLLLSLENTKHGFI